MKKLITGLLALAASTCSFGQWIDLEDESASSIAKHLKGYNLLAIDSFKEHSDEAYARFGVGVKGEAHLDKVWAVRINSSELGTQQIYLGEMHNLCNDRDEELEQVILNVNGQNVRFTRYCNGVNYDNFITTKKGSKYVVGEFKKKNWVEIEGFEYKLLFDATGFVNAWNNFGGDAL